MCCNRLGCHKNIRPNIFLSCILEILQEGLLVDSLTASLQDDSELDDSEVDELSSAAARKIT